MEFEQYQQNLQKPVNDAFKDLMIQVEEREHFYKKLLNKKEAERIELLQHIQQLTVENNELKEALNEAKLRLADSFVDKVEPNNTLSTICEEDYQQIIDDIQKAYIIESQRIVEDCLDDLIQYGEAYKAYIQVEDFWSILFVAYIFDRHSELYKTYENFMPLTQHKCHEQELYMKLLQLNNLDTEERDFEAVTKYIRDTSKDMVNIYPYIKNELLAEMIEVVEQMHRDFLIDKENKLSEDNELEGEGESLTQLVDELNKIYESDELEEAKTTNVKSKEEGQSLTELIKELLYTCKEEKQTKLEETSKVGELYSIPQINKAIKKYVDADEWGKLKSALRYVIKHYEHYQELFDEETFYEYLLMSYMFEYNEIFCKRFATARERLTTSSTGFSIYRMIEAEKNMAIYTTQLNCASRAMDQSIPKKNIFRQMDGKKVLKRLKKIAIPHTNKLQLMENLEKVVTNSNSLWKKYKVFVKTQEAKMILIEAWRKNDTGSWFITTETYQNIQSKLAKKQIKMVPASGMVENPSQDRNNEVSAVNYTKSSSIANVNKDTVVSEIPLNEKSPLKVLGYDTTKSKEERWRILTQQAIPKLGKQKVVWYINFFIKMHKKKATMASAIKEWEYDLRRLGAK